MGSEPFAWLVFAVPLLPLCTAMWFGLALAAGIRLRERTTAIAAIAVSVIITVASLAVLAVVTMAPGPARLVMAHWLFVPGHEIDLALWIDPLSAIMMAMTTALAFVVSWFSVAYLHREAGFQRYFMLVNLFVTGMLLLVMGDGFMLLFVGWEWVGICSALLIGFFHERTAPVRAGARAFFTNRLGDLGLITVALFASHEFGGDGWGPMTAAAGTLGAGMATAMGLALFLAAMGKSAQLPFSSWMVHAVEGPTTSTGLFYGAVMAHAGVYLMLRASPIVVQSDVTMIAMVVVGGATLVYATAVGAAQPDAKSAIIYATIAQLGGMFAACGAGAWHLVVVLMVLHAGLRATQFLYAPSIIVRTRAASHASVGSGAGAGRVVHTGLIGAALVVAAWGAMGLSDATWWHGGWDSAATADTLRDAGLAAAAAASVLVIVYLGVRRPGDRSASSLGARLHERALHRFDLDDWQVRLVVTPILAVAGALARFDDRFRDHTRAFVAAGLLVAGLVALESVTTGAGIDAARQFAVTDTAASGPMPWLSALWLVPAVTALLVHRIRDDAWARVFARGGAAATLALAIAVVRRFRGDVPGMQLVERVGGEVLGIGYHLGIDGISVVIVFLQAAVITLLLVAVGPRTRRPGLVAVLLLHALGMLALLSVNLLVLAVVALLSIIPGAALLRHAGPRPVTTGHYVRPMLVSGVLLLGVVLALGSAGPTTTFDFETIAAAGVPGWLEIVLFVPLLLAVAIRLPLVPFHGWMVRMLEGSPALVSIPLTLVPFGQYVFLRIGVELLGDALAQHIVLLSTFAVASMFYAVFVGLAQGSLRSSLAYYQLAIASGMLVGIAAVDPMGPTAGLLNACNLSIAGTGLLLVADMIHVRVGSTDFAALGGIVRTAPVLSGLLLVIALAHAGFPGTLGFIAEHLASHGAFATHPVIAIAMLAAINLAGALLWWSFTRACLGPHKTPDLAGFPEVLPRERAVLLTIAVIVIVAGWWLEPWVAMVQPTVAAHMPPALLGAPW